MAIDQSVKEEISQYKEPSTSSNEVHSNGDQGTLLILDTTNSTQSDEEQTNFSKTVPNTYREYPFFTKTKVDSIKEKNRSLTNNRNAGIELNDLRDSSFISSDKTINLYFDASDEGVIEISKKMSDIDSARLRVDEPLSSLPTYTSGLLFDTASIVLPVRFVDPEMEKNVLSTYGWFGLSVGSFGELDLPINKSKVDFSTEIGVKYLVNDYWFISAGISVSRSSFRTEFVQRNNVILYKPNTVDTIFQYSTGESNIVYRDSIMGIRTRSFGHSSRQTNYGIPLHFGYDFTKGSTVFTPELGALLSLSQRINARSVDNDFQYKDYNESKHFNFLLAFRAGMGISRKIGKGKIKVRYLFDFNPSITLSDYTIDGFYNHNVQIGYEYGF